jgi:23S rRNA pseudouridine2605 synthase
MEERLQKIISRAGVASRRHAEQLISTGQVTVNGRLVTELGSKADASRDHIKVSGKLLQGSEEKIYLVLNKPPNVVCTLQDPEGRTSLAELLRFTPARVFPVGRLPYAASGLLLLTNDGELTDQLFRAHKMTQTWWLKVRGELTREQMEAMGRKTNSLPRRVRPGANAWYEFAVRDAKGDSLRPLLALDGHPVEKMRRVRFGEIDLGALRPGEYRALTPAEMVKLHRMASPDYLAPAAEDPRATLRRVAVSGWRNKPAPKRSVHASRSGGRPRHDHGKRTSHDHSKFPSRRENVAPSGTRNGASERWRSKTKPGKPVRKSGTGDYRSQRQHRPEPPSRKQGTGEAWYSQSKFARSGRTSDSREARPPRHEGGRPTRHQTGSSQRRTDKSFSRFSDRKSGSPPQGRRTGSQDRNPRRSQDRRKGPRRG